MSDCENRTDDTTGIILDRQDNMFTVATRIFLPQPLTVVFPFSADAGNLEVITPPWVRFEILTPRPIPMCVGTIIEYRLLLRAIPLRWKSEITAWEPPRRFVDEQRRGPYRTWIHEHIFIEHDNGCEAHDFVRYDVLGGRLVNRLFVRNDVRRIFEYRAQRLCEIFG